MTLVKELPRQEQRIAMSYAEFLNYVDEDTHAEWVNGEAIIFMSAATLHQTLVGYLLILIRSYVDFLHLGSVFDAPYEMKVHPNANSREPDILFVSTQNLWRVTDKKLEGPADLVIEVISDDSVSRDRDEKFHEYQAAGIPEYWIFDPRPGRQRADFWVLDARGRYRPVPLDENDRYYSTVIPGFWLDTEWLWQEQLPDSLRALAQIIGPDKLITALSALNPSNK